MIAGNQEQSNGKITELDLDALNSIHKATHMERRVGDQSGEISSEHLKMLEEQF